MSLTYKEFMRNYCQTLGISVLDEELTKIFYITYAQDVSVGFYLRGGKKIYLSAALQAPGLGTAPDQLKKLMQLNLAGLKEIVGSLSINPENKQLTLYHSIDLLKLDPEIFERTIQKFVKSVIFWRQKAIEN